MAGMLDLSQALRDVSLNADKEPKMRHLLASLVAVSLVASPTTTFAAARTPSAIEEAETLRGSPILLILLIAAGLGLILALSSSEYNGPVSP